ncbi:metal ABC transporter permease [Leadbettera azotonutricia]|uniref:Putative ABC-3 n=1 Tax=Leadbettera azotonutricia (strain ATCC BAA-888 / DSM 13862 / ZAS-9) TaxID=545695 RepID=F5YC47_LEAAZ|nr:metal ABC transporter permease [Leadbettera azotonutricia]AEF82425.1 putative ABC-3 [Leadbettera azotonutricia ZAS-9]
MGELLAMPFFSRGLIALCATGIAFPVLGIFILNLELIPARFAVMHAALLGAAIALILGFSTTTAAMITSILAGIAIAIVSWRGRVSAGGSLGLIMTVCMGVAFIIFYKGNVHAIEAFNLFWGNILTLTDEDTRLTVITAVVILVFLCAAYKEIHIVLYDRELAWSVGVPAKLVYGGIMLSVCLGIAVAMRITGALLVDAVTILPALAARRIGKSFRALIIFGALFGTGMNLSGFAVSFVFDLPVSSAIIIIGAAALFIIQGIEFWKTHLLQTGKDHGKA